MSSSQSAVVSRDDRDDDEGLLIHLMSYYGAYHNHKETMAFSIFGLEGAFFIGLFSFANWPESVVRMDKSTLIGIFVVVWVLFHGALRFQLRARRLAALISAALYDALSGRVELPFQRSAYAVATEDPVLKLVDEWLFPVRRAVRPSDVGFAPLPDGYLVKPRTIDAYRFHLAKHKSKAQTTLSDYALPIEYVSSAGSILMLAIVLLRVSTLTPSPAAKGPMPCDCSIATPAQPAASSPTELAIPASAAASR
jgi:hypothetical protein